MSLTIPASDALSSMPQGIEILDDSNLRRIPNDVKVLIVQKLLQMEDGPKSTLALAKTSKFMHLLVHSKTQWSKRLIKRIKRAYLFALGKNNNSEKTEKYLLSLVTFIRKGARLSRQNVLSLTDSAISIGLFTTILKLIHEPSMPFWFKNPMTLRATYHTLINDDLPMTETLLKTQHLSNFQRGLLLASVAYKCTIKMARTLLKDVQISQKFRSLAFRKAFAHKNVDLVHLLIQSGPISDFALVKALSFAISIKDLEYAKLLYSNVPLSQYIKENALIDASRNADSQFVFDLLQQSSPISVSEATRGILVINFSGSQSWVREIRRTLTQTDDKDLVKLLLTDGPISDEDRGKALIQAIGANRVIALQLIQSGPISVKNRGIAVACAVYYTQIDIFEILLLSGPISENARGNACSNIKEGIPLKTQLSVLNKLLQSGSISDMDRGKACIWAAAIHSDLVQVLLQSGPISDKDREKSIQKAAWSRKGLGENDKCDLDQLKTIRILLKSGTISREDFRGIVLHSIKRGQKEIVQELLKFVSLSYEDRGKCVKKAVMQIDILLILLKSGGIYQKDRGKAALKALRNGNLDIFQILIKSGPLTDEDRECARKFISKNRNLKHKLVAFYNLLQPRSIEERNAEKAMVEAIHSALIKKNSFQNSLDARCYFFEAGSAYDKHV